MHEQAAGPGQPGASMQHLPTVNDPSYFADTPVAAAHDTAYPAEDVDRAQRLARTLGWFSVGLGLAQLLAPERVSRAAGVDGRPVLMRAVGARALASGVGLLTRRRTSDWMWSRVAGDAMDLALIGVAARSARMDGRRATLATAVLAGVAALDLIAGIGNLQRERRERGDDNGGVVELQKSIAVNRSPEDCYRFWHDFENFPNFMRHLKSVQITGENRMRWKARGPAGLPVEWDAEIIADEPNSHLAWRSLHSADIDSAGSVRFEQAPGGRGSIVRIDMAYRMPGGAAGNLLAKLFGEDPEHEIDEDLRRFKWLIETGEIPTTAGQPSGKRSAIGRLLSRKGAPG